MHGAYLIHPHKYASESSIKLLGYNDKNAYSPGNTAAATAAALPHVSII